MKDKVSIDDINTDTNTPEHRMLLEVLNCENPELKRPSSKVKFVNDETIKLISDMKETMLASDGIGLAAVQVGVHKRFFLFISDFENIDNDEEVEVKVVINPQILDREGESIAYEGCLSYPDHVAYVKRAIKINVRYYDQNMKKVETEFSGLPARIFQHELDHLDGFLFTDRMEPDSLKHVDELKDDVDDNDDDQADSIKISGGM